MGVKLGEGEEHRPRVFETCVVGKVSGHKMVEVTGQWRRLLTKYRIVRWAGYVAWRLHIQSGLSYRCNPYVGVSCMRV